MKNKDQMHPNEKAFLNVMNIVTDSDLESDFENVDILDQK